MRKMTKSNKLVLGGSLVLAGMGAGAVLMPGSASAATDAVSSTVTQAAAKVDPTKSVRSDEPLLTGATAAKVKAAVLATNPAAEVQRGGTDSDGVYEAHGPPPSSSAR